MSLTAGIIGGASLASAGIGALGASSAAGAQSDAANNAAQLQYQSGQNALNFQNQVWQQQQNNIAPYLQSGYGGLANLDYLLGIGGQGGQGTPQGSSPSIPGVGSTNPFPPSSTSPIVSHPDSTGVQPMNGVAQPQSRLALSPGGDVNVPTFPGSAPTLQPTGSTPLTPPTTGPGGVTSAPSLSSLVNPNLGGYGSLMQAYPGQFTAPTGLTEQNDPGYQARLQLGTDAIQRSAAASGGLLTGGTAKALDSYGQDYASNEYNNVYNRALTNYQTNYNQYQQQQANEFNRLASIAGIGQTSAGQLNSAGTSAANNASNTLLGTAGAVGQQLNNSAAATASGYTGIANSVNSGLGGLSGLAGLSAILGNSGGLSSVPSTGNLALLNG
jgi:hypothetical protein